MVKKIILITVSAYAYIAKNVPKLSHCKNRQLQADRKGLIRQSGFMLDKIVGKSLLRSAKIKFRHFSGNAKILFPHLYSLIHLTVDLFHYSDNKGFIKYDDRKNKC